MVQPNWMRLFGKEREDFFSQFQLDDNIEADGLRDVLYHTLAVYEDNRPTAAQLMQYFDYYKGIQWKELFMQTLDLNNVYEMKLKDWFEILIHKRDFRSRINKL